MNILLVDDHTLFREGMAILLRSLLDNLNTFEAGNCAAALDTMATTPDMDLVLLDLGLPNVTGFEALETMRRGYPDVPVVVLSGNEDRFNVLGAIDRGAMGFIPKTSSSAVLAAALKLILAKGIYLPATILLNTPENHAPQLASAQPAPDDAGQSHPAGSTQLVLTPRQNEVLALMLQGKSSKAICRDLGLSISTVKAHTSAALRALNVTTRTQAVVAASRLGLRF